MTETKKRSNKRKIVLRKLISVLFLPLKLNQIERKQANRVQRSSVKRQTGDLKIADDSVEKAQKSKKAP